MTGQRVPTEKFGRLLTIGFIAHVDPGGETPSLTSVRLNSFPRLPSKYRICDGPVNGSGVR